LVTQGSDADAMDTLLGPIALNPDPLLAQVLTSATSPDQVTKFHTWLGQQTATGSDLQKAAMDAGFEASFASLALFPQVVSHDGGQRRLDERARHGIPERPEERHASVQRLRTKAKAAGTLKTNEQQTVTTQSSGSTQTIVIQPANPQVVYVPTYDPQVVYAPPPQSSSGDAAVAALLAFGVGIAIGAAVHDEPWDGNVGVWVAGGRRVVPSRGLDRSGAPEVSLRPPVPVYRPSRTVVAPRRTNVNINVNNNKVNIGNQINVGNRSRNIDNSRNMNVSKGNTGIGDRTPNAGTASSSFGDRGRSTPSAGGSGRSGGGTSALGGYGMGRARARRAVAARRRWSEPGRRAETVARASHHHTPRPRGVTYASHVPIRLPDNRHRAQPNELFRAGTPPSAHGRSRRPTRRPRRWPGRCRATIRPSCSRSWDRTRDRSSCSQIPWEAQHDGQVVAAAMAERWWLEGSDSASRTLVMGNESWPFPIPIVRTNGSWRFDTAAGKEEVLHRRIGSERERGHWRGWRIRRCAARVRIRRARCETERDLRTAVPEHARSPGRSVLAGVGLDEATEPMGALAAEAAADGYKASDAREESYHGYYFRILTAQGTSAPGGARSYVANGAMRGGFAMIAWPADYGASGIMTFMVGPDGVSDRRTWVRTRKRLHPAVAAYDPDSTWTVTMAATS
jgi:hypothetical protein